MVSEPESPPSRLRALVPKRGWFLLPRSDNRHGLRLRFGVQLALFVLLGVGVLVGSGSLLLHGIGGALRLGRLGASEQLDIIKIALSVVAGVGGVIALTVAYRKQQLGEAAEARAEHAHRREETKLFTERFGACVAQLGDDSPAIRLGGAYSLAHLADDWEEGRQTCIDVLCAQLRMPYPSDQPEDAEAHAAFLSQREVRHTIWRLIGDHLRSGRRQHSWDGNTFNFTAARIDGADFHGVLVMESTLVFSDCDFLTGVSDFRFARIAGGAVDFSSASFAGGTVDFSNAAFAGGAVDFSNSTLSDGAVIFSNATFSGSTVKFSYAEFSGGKLSLDIADFSGGAVDFIGAKFTDGLTSFTHAKFSGGAVNLAAYFDGGTVTFRLAKFSAGVVSFKVATFSGGAVNFAGANFSGGKVDLSHAVFCDGLVNFSKASFSGATVDLSHADFTGSEVDFSEPRDLRIAPLFPTWSVPPPGLILPK